MPSMWNTLALIFFVVLLLFLADLIRMFLVMAAGSAVVSGQTYFESKKENATLNILLAGDSIIYGSGASSPEATLAGQLAEDFPSANILNQTSGPWTAKGLAREFRMPSGNFDLTIISIGGNDIANLSSLGSIENNTKKILETAKQKSDVVVLLHSDDIGKAPLFSPLIGTFMLWRSLEMKKRFEKICSETGSLLVYISDETISELKNRKPYYAQDLVHPNDKGYKLWYGAIIKKLDEEGVKLK